MCLHQWRIKYETKVYLYKICKKCGKKKTVQITCGGYQPVRKNWPKPSRNLMY